MTAAPEQGRANEAVLRLLADALAVPRNAVVLVSGHGGRDKIVELTGLGPALADGTGLTVSIAAAEGTEAQPLATSTS